MARKSLTAKENTATDAMQELVEIEAIKKLKARYQRAVDTKDWDLMRSVLAPDARWDKAAAR